MKFRGVTANFDQPLESFLIYGSVAGAKGRVRENVQIDKLIRHFRPQWLQCAHSIRRPFHERIAEPEEISWLEQFGVIPQSRFERRYCRGVVRPAVFHQSDVNANSG